MLPPYLKKGSVIGITCPSSAVAIEKINSAAEIFKEKGFKVKLGKTCGAEFNYFSGTDDERLNDLQAMLDDPEIDAIMMGRGGYGMSRIIDGLDFTTFKQSPKWICGFSDIVVLQSHLQANFEIPTLHSPMCRAFRLETEKADHIQTFFKTITGAPVTYSIPPSTYNRKGKAEAILTGGNLAILAHLTGSVSEVNMDGKILFIEDIGEHKYHIDRMMLNLKRAGKLNKLKGLIVGYFTDVEDTDRPFGQTVEQIILDKVKEFDFPVCFNFPAGHEDINYTLTLGMEHKLAVNENGGHLELIK
jgi:muramoyltetrapeptide carboxypeptidase